MLINYKQRSRVLMCQASSYVRVWQTFYQSVWLPPPSVYYGIVLLCCASMIDATTTLDKYDLAPGYSCCHVLAIPIPRQHQAINKSLLQSKLHTLFIDNNSLISWRTDTVLMFLSDINYLFCFAQTEILQNCFGKMQNHQNQLVLINKFTHGVWNALNFGLTLHCPKE